MGGPKLIDPFLGKVEEWVDRSEGKVRADIVHDRLAAMGFGGSASWRAVSGASGKAERGGALRRIHISLSRQCFGTTLTVPDGQVATGSPIS